MTPRYLFRIDIRVVLILICIQVMSLVTISSFSSDLLVETDSRPFFHPIVTSQLHWMMLGWGCFFLATCFDYAKLREWAWIIYGVSIIALIGLFFTDHIARVQRWYRLPILGIGFQPSECVKLALVIALSWYLERRAHVAESLSTLFGALVIAAIPFLLILKQPDLGTAMILYPMTLVILYFGGVKPYILRLLYVPGMIAVFLVFLTFSGLVDHETLRPHLAGVLKEYQCDRLNPETHHQNASQTAIALGGTTGAGWRQGEFWRGGSLPAPYTDSIFSAFGEEFGLLGLISLLLLYYIIIFCCFQTVAVAKDPFGRLISAGIAVYLAIHVLINVGMMCGCLPITGVPLVLMSYGGSSMMATMTALGIIQSVYSRRFMF